MKINGKEMLEAYWKIILVAALAVILAVFLVKCGSGDAEPEDVTAENLALTESVSETTQTTDRNKEDNPLQQDTIPELKELMEQFFQAKFDCDIETLRQLVNPIDGYTEESLYEDRYGGEENSIFEIESYHVESCYSKKGLVEGTYIVWVYVDIKYVNAETPAPALFRMYICTDESGYYIYNGSLEGEISTYRDEISAKEDVLELVNMVNQRFQEAVNHDEQLKKIVLSMEGADKAEETQSQTESSQAE